MPTSNRDNAPLVRSDDRDLGHGATCDICGHPARVIDGPVIEFALHPRRLICAHCVKAVVSAAVV